MLIQYASDLHLGFEDNYRFVELGGLAAEGEILLLAGDIVKLSRLNYFNDFWDWCEDNFQLTIFVPGNHDFYGKWKSLEGMASPIRKKIRENVLCCSNTVVRCGSADIICSTLWSHVPPQSTVDVASTLWDFKKIFVNENPLTVEQYNELHRACREFVERAVEESSADKKIVVTHHLPSYAVVSERFQNSPLNPGFATELGEWILDSSIDYWIYGHSHESVETEIGRTKLLSNQLGYLSMGEGQRYSLSKCFSLES